jgi:hypothetical protein
MLTLLRFTTAGTETTEGAQRRNQMLTKLLISRADV